jgi:hypothetical protein
VGETASETVFESPTEMHTAVESPPKSDLPTQSPRGERLSGSVTLKESISLTLTESISLTEGGSTRVFVVLSLAVWSRSFVYFPQGTLQPEARAVSPELIIGVSVGAGLAIAVVVAVIVHIRRRGESVVSSMETATERPVVFVAPPAESVSGGTMSFSGDTAAFMSNTTEVVEEDSPYWL